MASDPSTKEVESGGPVFQGYPWLRSMFEAMLDYERFCLKKKYNLKKPDKWENIRIFALFLGDIYTKGLLGTWKDGSTVKSLTI